VSHSLQARALLVATLILAVFLGATGLVLDQAFRDSSEAVMRDRIQGYAEALKLTLENEGPEGLEGPLPATLNERLRQPNSGLYAIVRDINGDIKRAFPSLYEGLSIPWPPLPDFWSGRLDPVRLPDGQPLYVLSLTTRHQPRQQRKPAYYILQIAEAPDAFEGFYYDRVNQVRRDLWRWALGVAGMLLVLQAVILRWSFAPLRQVAADLRDIEAGRTPRLAGRYPAELRGLTDNLNALLDNAESHLARYRDALGDLAHSLKTPLAVLRGTVEAPAAETDPETRAVAREQIERMNLIVEYQLKRAAASGRSHLAAPVNVADKAGQVAAALRKVYADKGVECRVEIDPELVFKGDEGDLLEILGNLADNAFKWCRQRVEIGARWVPGPAGAGLEIRVEDDGPGIAPEVAERVVGRGQRADTTTPGHGLGLAIVHSIVRAYHGRLGIDRSPLGGARVSVRELG
jgi:two-component system sensor histidine kinase PhoQ